MKRQLCVTVFFALVLVPDWVSACWPPAGGSYDAPVYTYYAPAPVYYAPAVYCQPVYVQPCVPVAAPQPTVQPKVERAKPGATLEAPKSGAPTRPPQIETVRPAASAEPPVKPDPVKPKIEFVPPEPETKAPAVIPKLPPLVLPGEKAEPKLPSLELPKDAEPKLPSLELPKIDAPKPEVPGAPAIPVPAPAPDALIPPPGVSVPRSPDALPPLTLPPDAPVSPDVKPTEAKSSPLTGAAKVTVFPAAGAVAGNGLRKIGFYNHTDRELSLTIEGQAVKLPAKSYLHAQLPQAFTWAHADRATKEVVPADASGLDVVFRE